MNFNKDFYYKNIRKCEEWKIITFVKGKIPESELKDFLAAYASMKEETNSRRVNSILFT